MAEKSRAFRVAYVAWTLTIVAQTAKDDDEPYLDVDVSLKVFFRAGSRPDLPLKQVEMQASALADEDGKKTGVLGIAATLEHKIVARLEKKGRQ